MKLLIQKILIITAFGALALQASEVAAGNKTVCLKGMFDQALYCWAHFGYTTSDGYRCYTQLDTNTANIDWKLDTTLTGTVFDANRVPYFNIHEIPLKSLGFKDSSIVKSLYPDSTTNQAQLGVTAAVVIKTFGGDNLKKENISSVPCDVYQFLGAPICSTNYGQCCLNNTCSK